MYYSSSLNGLIPLAWKLDGTYTEASWPADAVILTEDELSKFQGKSAPAGKQLGSIEGRPAWVDTPPPPALTREEVDQARRNAYANPLTGSDRFFSEAIRMQMNSMKGWEKVKEAGDTRHAEIQAAYPWPESN